MSRRATLFLASTLAAACGDDLRPSADGGHPGDAAPPDGATSPPVIEREQAGGAPSAVEIAGELIYVAVGPRVLIWGAEGLVGETDSFPGMVTGVAIAGDRAFVAEHTDLRGRI